VNSLTSTTAVNFTIQKAAGVSEVWDVTDPTTTLNIPFQFTGSSLTFKQTTDSLRTYIAFNASGFLVPNFKEKISSQNLHAAAVPDMVIVYHPLFKNQVDQLVTFHENNGLTVFIASVQEIYNEFSGGIQDVTAIKTFAKMFYDRSTSNEFKYLLLFGDGSYDYKARVLPNHNFVPLWESENSLSDISSYTTDDFYALLDDTESMEDYEMMDIAVGRLTVTSASQAQNVVNKIINYQKTG